MPDHSDELAFGMKRWLEVHFISLKNIFLPNISISLLIAKKLTSYGCVVGRTHYTKEQAFENISSEDLKSESGLSKLLAFLDTELEKDATNDIIEKWDDFDSCKKSPNQTVEFISDFEMKSNRVKSSGTKLSCEVLAFMLMKRAGLSNLERMLVLSRVDMADKTNMYKNVKLSMSNILG